MNFIIRHIFTAVLLYVACIQGKLFKAEFRSVENITHQAIDLKSGRVYLGCTNKLYQLTGELEYEFDNETGPVGGVDNENKALLVFNEQDKLITCGTSYKGTCVIRDLANISLATAYSERVFYGSQTQSFAFLAPAGPYESSGTGQMAMYIGTSSTEPIPPPLISTRRLEESGSAQPFDIFKKMTKAEIDPNSKGKFNVEYISGFSHKGFSYFLTVQPVKQGSMTYESRIVRICQQDQRYASYIELPIKCSVGSRIYNSVQDAFVTESGSKLANSMNISTNESILYAVFSNRQRDGSSKLGDQSAICIYSLRDIRLTLFNATKSCFDKGIGKKVKHVLGLTEEQFDKDKNCLDVPLLADTITEDYCASNKDISINYPLLGMTSIEAQPVLEFRENLTAVAVTDVNDFTIAFLGAANGSVKKITISSPVHGREYEDVPINPNHAVGQDILFDKNKTHIYATAGNKVVKMRVTDCSRHLNCDACLGSGDPYCGWCSLEKKCSMKNECGHSYMPLRWLGQGTSQCIAVDNMTPNMTSLDRPMTIAINITNLPKFPDQPVPYYCIFGDLNIAYPATVAIVGGLHCKTPPIHLIPPLVDKDYVAVRLKIRSTQTGIDFLETDFFFYKCETHALCGKCVLTKWPCNWCIYDNKCTHNSSLCSSDFIYSINYPYIARLGGKEYCPQLVASNGTEILLPHGEKKEIVVGGKNLPKPQGGYFECVVRQGDSQEIRQPAMTRNDTVVCLKDKPFVYTEDEEYLQVPLTIAWTSSEFNDPPYYFDSDIKVTMYKCDKMGPDCSRCTSPFKIDAKFKCAWCTDMDRCVFNKRCKTSIATAVKCNNPYIAKFEPKSGPIEGGTNLTIYGKNLGKTFEDINGTDASIVVAGRPCIPYKDFYVIAEKIICRIGPKPKHVMTEDGPVSIKLNNGQRGKSKPGEKFECRDPRIKKIFPSLGPKAGLSQIKISGDYLDTGVREATRAYIGVYPCEINESISKESITCYSSPVNSSRIVSNITVVFDGHSRMLHAVFNYTEDPTITSIEPLTSIKSGGIPVTVTGTNFLSIRRPLMFVRRGNWRSEETDCEVKSDIKIICPAPNVTEDFLPVKRVYRAERATPSKETFLDIGFKMDGVQSVQAINESFPGVAHTITYTLDPEYFPFEGQVKNYVPGESSRLIIEGRNLKLGNSAKDVQVLIGDEKCNITSLAPTELSCIPPEHQPAGVNEESLPVVMVFVGNLRFKLGTLLYKVDSDVNFPPVAIYSIAGAAGLLLLIIVVILIVCKRKSTKHEREFKHLQIQLDTWESNVREECKQGFAELQTDMTDLTSDLNAAGIPFWSYQMYTFRVLFPGLKDHPILHKTEVFVRNSPKTTVEQAMTQFNQLVINKNFLLTFIRTLEEQKGFSIRDKANVASLLMIILQDKMEYATEIVKVLLNELIDKYVEKKQPKLLLRRTESVVEKLLANWLSICLYENLKESTGKPLFMLFKAIKHQVEKGPVDAVTADARYSLSEDRLLREKTLQNFVNVNIVLDDGEIIQCKVLLCDTITQVKEKMLDMIYKNSPFTHRPSVYDLDLEWRRGRSGQGHLCLQDDDVTSNVDPTGWKKINTLEHYKVPDDEQMALVPKQHDSLGRSPCNGGLNGNLSAVSMTSITPILQDIESGAKIYHLVKQCDFDSSGKDRSHKVITEIFLPRLLSTKGTLQTFVDDLFKTILSVDDQLPTAIKYLFDFLDEAAARHTIIDQEVIYTWKSNSLPLRFWVNIIKNPNFTFDVHKPAIVDSCLSVIAQTFMDSCSTTEHRLGKDSPTNKLLYAKDIPNYKKMVSQYYQDIQSLSPVSDQDMKIYLGELSKIHPTEINVTVALKTLYDYVAKYKTEVRESIEEIPTMTKETNKLEQVISAMDSTESIA